MIDSVFDLPWGSDINAYVIATNVYGFSEASFVGNGATILTNPDKPINPITERAIRSLAYKGRPNSTSARPSDAALVVGVKGIISETAAPQSQRRCGRDCCALGMPMRPSSPFCR